MSEIEHLKNNNELTETTALIPQTFAYSLLIGNTDNNADLYANYADNRIAITMNTGIAQEWLNTDKVGVSYRYIQANEQEITLLVEKDFKCIDADITEDQSDYFENPLKSC